MEEIKIATYVGMACPRVSPVPLSRRQTCGLSKANLNYYIAIMQFVHACMFKSHARYDHRWSNWAVACVTCPTELIIYAISHVVVTVFIVIGIVSKLAVEGELDLCNDKAFEYGCRSIARSKTE
jgi:hypothetical protein